MILFHSEEQRRAAEAWIANETTAEGRRPLTEILSIDTFTRAENDHQKYRLQTAFRLRDVVAELQSSLGSFQAFVDSTVAARLNGYFAGWAPRERLERHIDAFGLSGASVNAVLDAVR